MNTLPPHPNNDGLGDMRLLVSRIKELVAGPLGLELIATHLVFDEDENCHLVFRITEDSLMTEDDKAVKIAFEEMVSGITVQPLGLDTDVVKGLFDL